MKKIIILLIISFLISIASPFAIARAEADPNTSHSRSYKSHAELNAENQQTCNDNEQLELQREQLAEQCKTNQQLQEIYYQNVHQEFERNQRDGNNRF